MIIETGGAPVKKDYTILVMSPNGAYEKYLVSAYTPEHAEQLFFEHYGSAFKIINIAESEDTK